MEKIAAIVLATQSEEENPTKPIQDVAIFQPQKEALTEGTMGLI